MREDGMIEFLVRGSRVKANVLDVLQLLRAMQDARPSEEIERAIEVLQFPPLDALAELFMDDELAGDDRMLALAKMLTHAQMRAVAERRQN